MDFFPTLGAAVLGIFATIILSGILAGIIAFGLIEFGFRRQIQKRTIDNLIEEPVADFLHSGPNRDPFNLPNEENSYLVLSRLIKAKEFNGEFYSWSRFDYIRNLFKRRFRDRSMVADLLRINPDHLFALPYRQLCGQIANIIGAESYDEDFDVSSAKSPKRRYKIQPLTLALLIADHKRDLRYFESDSRMWRSDSDLGYISVANPKVRALAYLDSVQIALVNAILDRARLIALAVITLILTSILIPNLGMLNIWAESSSAFSRSAGATAAVMVALVIGGALVFAATVVAVLTFGWIDRHASAR